MVFTIGDVIGSASLAMSLTLSLVVVGLPISWLVGRAVPGSPISFGMCWLFGLGSVSLLSWYAFGNGLAPAWAYRSALALGGCCLLPRLADLIARRRGRQAAAAGHGGWLEDVSAYLACMLLFILLCFSNVRHGDLPWVTNGNNDLLAYLKMGSYLLHFPVDLQMSDTKDIHDFAYTDVFGAFDLIAFGAFATRVGVEHFAIPTMAATVGMIGMAMARCCRRLFGLGALLSLLLATLTLTCPLFSYITLNYFLGQMLLIATLSTVTLYLTETIGCEPSTLRCAAGVGPMSSLVVLLCYPPWFIQYVAILSFVAAVLSVKGAEQAVHRWAAVVVVRTVGFAAYLIVVLGLVSFTRVGAALTRLAVVSKANVAGWPLSFVDLDLLLGLPGDWRMHGDSGSILGRSLAVLSLVAVVFAILRRFDRDPNRFARSFLVAVFAVSVVAYLVVWAWFGASYQQWKFATTIPLAYGFVIPAAAIHLSIMAVSRRASVAMRSVAACAAAAVIILNLHQYRDRWSRDVYHFPASLSSAKLIDAMPGAARGYIKADDYLARMGASVFVVRKPVTFSGPTYWGDASSVPDDGPFVMVEAACHAGQSGGANYMAQTVAGGAIPILPLDMPVPLGGNINACIDIDGFSGAEAEGRWTAGRHASIRLACGCYLSRDAVNLVIDASPFLIGGRVDRQRAIFRVNGAAPQEFDLVSAARRELNIRIPLAPAGDSTVDVAIDLPDAISPTLVGSQDARVLGLFIHGLELRRLPPSP